MPLVNSSKQARECIGFIIENKFWSFTSNSLKAMNTIRLVFALLVFSVFSLSVHAQGSTQQIPPLTDWFLSTGDWQNAPQLYVYEIGSGTETVVFLHGGWGGDHQGFLEAVQNQVKGYRFVFYDQRGSLRSPFPDSLITFDNHIEDLERLRQALKQDKLTIVGHSMGAILASAYASKYPQRVKRLILMTPAYLKNPLPQEDQQLLQSDTSFQTFMKRPTINNELNKYALNRTSPALSSQEETAKSRINFARRMLYDVTNWPKLRGGGALYKGNVFELTARSYPASGWDYIKEFKNAPYTVSIIAADHDFLDFKNRLIKKWAAEAPNVKLSFVKNAGHLLWFDQQVEFEKQLAAFLKK